MAKKVSSKKTTVSEEELVLKELIDIKRLMALALLRDGAKQDEIAAALGISQPSVSRMFPGGITAALRSTKNKKR